ncbi:hypothetical protein VCHA52P456_400001 [Vibrio chagasii]|nr:hypothetical protein VCHA52P456_400001 [Vibrio chagasii]
MDKHNTNTFKCLVFKIESGKHVIRTNPSCYNQKPWLFTIHKTSSGCMVK